MEKQIIIKCVNLTNELQILQDLSGIIVGNNKQKAIQLLTDLLVELKQLGRKYISNEYLSALELDINNYINSGCTDINFDNSVEHLDIPKQSAYFLFFGPLRLANAKRKGWKFEFFISLREEPISDSFNYMYRKYPHPKNICQSSKLIYGSNDILDSNNIVFFPENVKSNIMFNKQKCAVFFFDKFYRIYNNITIPLLFKIGLNEDIKYSRNLSKEDNYNARCVWGYLHDYYHHQGSLPFDENIKIKTNWYVGVLEEIKVDLQTLSTLALDKNLPYNKETYEFVLFDRIFRYTQEVNPYNNFDSATSFFLICYFYKNNVIKLKDNRISVEYKNIQENINHLISDIIHIENTFGHNKEVYIEKCKEFFFSHLNKPTIEKTNYLLPNDISIILKNVGLIVTTP
ncbi:DUF6421 family protein [Snodgrassella sp.]|uniref:DUF6421 family protein n=1 Tax=Snodgrassella sp. TaxID=2815304 RepID=UPI00258C1DD7|nr:DUF6421 family protein [Snodgrassella sp.]MCO6525801.1 hypothetical protein [Snodgrassella sp.]